MVVNGEKGIGNEVVGDGGQLCYQRSRKRELMGVVAIAFGGLEAYPTRRARDLVVLTSMAKRRGEVVDDIGRPRW